MVYIYMSFLKISILINKNFNVFCLYKKFNVFRTFSCYFWFATAKRIAIFHLLNQLYRSSLSSVIISAQVMKTTYVMNMDSSLETCPFATFRPPTTFYNLFKQGGQWFSKTKFQAFPGFFSDFWTIFQGALQHFQGPFTNTLVQWNFCVSFIFAHFFSAHFIFAHPNFFSFSRKTNFRATTRKVFF